MIHVQFQSAFGDITFKEVGHSYEYKGTPLVSVTTLLKKLKPFFDSAYWLVYKTLEYSGYKVQPRPDTRSIVVDGNELHFDKAASLDVTISPKQLKETWDITAKIGTTRGTALHNYIEQLWKRQELAFKYPEWVYELDTKNMSILHNSVTVLKTLGLDFYNTIKNTHVPVFIEYTVGDEDLGIAGTFDALLYNMEAEQYEIWDWKTDKKFEKTSRYKIKHFDVADCELNKYSLQLGIYKYIIEKNTKIKIGACNVVYFDWKNNKYEVIECKDYDNLIHEVFTNGLIKSTLK